MSEQDKSCQFIATEISAHGVCVYRDFLSRAEVAGLRTEISSLQNTGRFRQAGIGHEKTAILESEIRGDSICWFEPSELLTGQAQLWHKLAELKSVINRELFLGLWDLEGHFAVYAPGAFYKRHRDSFEANNRRVFTVVIYLNQDWQPADGGILQLYLPDATTTVEPKAGTLVCFLSDQIEHEVLPAHRERMSFTGWFRRR